MKSQTLNLFICIYFCIGLDECIAKKSHLTHTWLSAVNDITYENAAVPKAVIVLPFVNLI